MLGQFHGKFLKIMGLEAPETYCGPFWFNSFSILLERPKPNIFMISGFLDPWEALLMDLNIPKYFQRHQTTHMFKNMSFF